MFCRLDLALVPRYPARPSLPPRRQRTPCCSPHRR